MHSALLVIICYAIFTLCFGNIGIYFPYENTYGEGYGKSWIYFPDGDGIPRFVNLTMDTVNFRSYFAHDDIEFRVYTRRNSDNYTLLNHEAESLDGTMYFDEKAPVKVITHGWMSSGDKDSVIKTKDAYLKHFDVNIIAVDWSAIADSVFYPWAALQVPSVGKTVGKFVDALSEKYNIRGEQMHLIGHSLGAHVMGVASASTKLNISRVTGLDPASPLFEFPERDLSERLDPSDAAFVDVIHTCAGVLGFRKPLGHVDFYPNNGTAPQPGCNGIQAMFESCSHGKSHYYFMKSIEDPTKFHISSCKNENSKRDCAYRDDSVFMGNSIQNDLRGVFYLDVHTEGDKIK